MKLTKKKDFSSPTYTNEPVVYKKGERYDPRIHQLLPDVLIPHGKFKGRTLGYVREHEDWYYSWMVSEHLITAWGLCRQKDKKTDSRVSDKLVLDNGDIWIQLREVQIQGSRSIYL